MALRTRHGSRNFHRTATIPRFSRQTPTSGEVVGIATRRIRASGASLFGLRRSGRFCTSMLGGELSRPFCQPKYEAVSGIILSAASAARHGLHWLSQPHVPALDVRLGKEGKGSSRVPPHNLFFRDWERILESRHCRRWFSLRVRPRMGFLNEYNQICGKDRRQRQAISESAFRSGTSARFGRPSLRGSGTPRDRVVQPFFI